MKLNTKFSVNDLIYIIPLKITGRVLAIYVAVTGTTFNVRYFDGLKPCDCYFTEDELSLEQPENKVGFQK